MERSKDLLRRTFFELLALSIPQQFVGIAAIHKVAEICTILELPQPKIIAGNIVIGELSKAKFMLSAHLDEASFNVTSVCGKRATLAPCHRFVSVKTNFPIQLIGIRDGLMKVFPPISATVVDGVAVCVAEDVQLGDRAVYYGPAEATGDLVQSKAIDDRAGAAIALHALAELKAENIPAAIVLSDGEQNAPDGYFSRNFPHILRLLSPSCTIVFVDGIFGEAVLPDHSFCHEALLVPHTGSGRGYTVPPLLFGTLRDRIVPAARRAGIPAELSSLYHSRGDDWGLVTNPTSGQENEAFFVSFYGWGATPGERNVYMDSLKNCVNMVRFACHALNGGL